jgi:hypothetical protein
MLYFNFSKTILFNIPAIYPARREGRKIHFKTAPKSPEGDLKLQPFRLTMFRKVRHYLVPIIYILPYLREIPKVERGQLKIRYF